MDYRLTTVIPTHDRPELLPRAVDSILRQTVPARVVVADDGDADRTADVLRRHFGEALGTGQLAHIRTGATSPWGNWRAGAEAADTEFVAWVQDDDVICRQYVERMLFAFDEAGRKGTRPHLWLARLDAAQDTPFGLFGLHYAHNGPYVPLRTLHGICEPAHFDGGPALAAAMFLSAWSLNPAQAYRDGPEFRAALSAMPAGCEVFIERLMPAEMAQAGGFVADPATVGYFVQHDGNLSRVMHKDQARQTAIFLRHMDDLLDRIGADAWRGQFAGWCRSIAPALLWGWAQQFEATEREGGESRHGDDLRRIMEDSLEGRIKVALPRPARKKERGRAKATAKARR